VTAACRVNRVLLPFDLPGVLHIFSPVQYDERTLL
jgi:hypothetical protein